MEFIIRLFEEHGVLGLFLAVFIEQAGAPIPAVPFLLLAGARGASDPVLLASAVLSATSASMLADVLWFYAGRRFGRSVLGVLCRVSASPDTCVLKTETSFNKRGAWTIVFAKFIPGASTVARPLAGALGMGLRPFLLLNLAGTLLWVGSSLVAGVVLRSEVLKALRALEGLGSAAVLVLGAGLALYISWRIARRIFARHVLRGLPRIEAGSLAALLEAGEDILMLDVRSNESSNRERVPGAVQAAFGSKALQEAPVLAAEAMVITYCDCPGDATAAKAAMQLAKLGIQVWILSGGIEAWRDAGLPLEGERTSASDQPAPGVPQQRSDAASGVRRGNAAPVVATT